MKKISSAILALLLFCVLQSCNKANQKKEYTCGYDYYYNPERVVFSNFTASDLQQVVVAQYAANTDWNNLLQTDTINLSGAAFEHDTAYADGAYAGFFSIEKGKDYKITVLSTASTFRITDIREGEQHVSWTQDQECSMGASQDRITSYLLKVNDQDYNLFYKAVNNYLVCLTR